jgi:predicted CXXCH cytochrome family protein
MMTKFVRRLALGSIFAVVAGLVAVAIGEAGSPGQEGPVRTDCASCHESVVTTLAGSAHGQALADPVFRSAWKEAGNSPECLACHVTGYHPESGDYDEEGVTCAACHQPMSGPHPGMPMSVDASSRLCGECHIDTYAEWQVSAHGEGEMGCTKCHSPHTANLKVSGVAELCITCHNEQGHFFNYTGHASVGLGCTDCHLRVSDSTMGQGHGARVHTFEVDLATCTRCHGGEMHFPVDKASTAATEEMMQTAYAIGENEPLCRTAGPIVTSNPEPQPAQPFTYLIVAAVGLVFGIAVTPWAEEWYRQVLGRSEEFDDER